MVNKNPTVDRPALETLRDQVINQLRHVGVQQGVGKPGDGRYSTLLRKPTR